MAPYGYIKISDWLVPCPEQKRGIDMILRLKKEGLSFPEISRQLDRIGIRPKNGQAWMLSSLHKLYERYKEVK